MTPGICAHYQDYQEKYAYKSGRNGIITVTFVLKPVTSIKETGPYNLRSKSNRHRNVWEMDEDFQIWACNKALGQESHLAKPYIKNPFDIGSTNVYRIDGTHLTIAYKCPVVPPTYLEGRVDLVSKKAQITILTEIHRSSSQKHRPTVEDQNEWSFLTSPSSPSNGSGYSSTSSKSASPLSGPRSKPGSPTSGAPIPGSRYTSAYYASLSPPQRRKHRDPSSRPLTSAPRYRDTYSRSTLPSAPASTSRLSSNSGNRYAPASTPRLSSNSGNRYVSMSSPPTSTSPPVRRRFGLGQFIYRLVA